MGKEIKVGVDREHIRAFSEVVKSYPDLRGLNPHLAARYKIADHLQSGEDVRLSASVNGGRLNVFINGSQVKKGGELTREGLGSVIDVYSSGRGKKIAASMLAKGVVVVLKGF
ncbi:MAG: hypothetical protein ACD_16C00047G0001 [uncultured bacterium]|nr:MAG: hypothetical protein ACD_16C00047G0001 [uncultured bacterium]